MRRRFLSGHSEFLQVAAATEFDDLEASQFFHELELGNQPLLAREQEDRGGVYESNAKFGIAIYLVPVLHALIVGMKMLKALESLPLYACTILNFEEKSLETC